MRTEYDYKPVPKYKEGDMVFRCWAGLWRHTPERISRVVIKEHNGKWYMEYYFFRERTPYNESDLYPTLKDILQAEAEFLINKTMGQLKFIKETAERKGIELNIKSLPIK